MPIYGANAKRQCDVKPEVIPEVTQIDWYSSWERLTVDSTVFQWGTIVNFRFRALNGLSVLTGCAMEVSREPKIRDGLFN